MQLQCQACKKEFKWWEFRPYCSRECFFSEHRRFSVCPTCGKTRILQKNQPQKDYCSLRCWGVHHRVVVERKCSSCDKLFRPKSRTKRGKYCSKRCSDVGRTLPIDEYKRRQRERTRRYRREHPNKTASWKQKRRAIEAGAEGHFTETEWRAKKESFDGRCAICHEQKKLTVDHIVPLSRGGSNHIENIQPLCLSCNSRKWAKT